MTANRGGAGGLRAAFLAEFFELPSLANSADEPEPDNVPPLAAVCRPLLQPKGNQRATSSLPPLTQAEGGIPTAVLLDERDHLG